MKFNLTRPLQLAQWFSYIMGICIVQFLIILPLSALLFHDFYIKLLPPDSSQWISINNFERNVIENKEMVVLAQQFRRVTSQGPLIPVDPNGIPQTADLRVGTSYKLDLQLDFYCKNLNSSDVMDLQEVSIRVLGSTGDVYYHYRGPILCKSSAFDTTVLDGNKQLVSRTAVVRNEWLNKVHIDDMIHMKPGIAGTVEIIIDLPGPELVIIPDPSSGILVRRFFGSGLRNWMLRWWRTTYIVGISMVYISISSIFVITCIAAFYTSRQIKSNSKKKD
ncbi:hypothetical protein RNJ44_03157 [Nakaseomyces bracarensis]|uniref:Seipin n=1 Tax=Nakaseomyces bracarensis TaxID=273131 RepID=A0ABR4NZ60_9SACH